jgi:murein DD-endopeptidase MepM/ murein hydrolase activator NlpD
MPDRPHPPNRHSSKLLATDHAVERGDSYTVHKFTLLTGFVAVGGAWLALWTAGIQRCMEPHRSLPLSPVAIDAPLAVHPPYETLAMRDPPLSFLDRLANPHKADMRGGVKGADKHSDAKPGASGAATQPVEGALTRTRSGGGWRTISVRPGENLWSIFARLDADRQDFHEILRSPAARTDLGQLRPGEKLKLRLDNHQVLQEIIYQYDVGRALQLRRIGGQFRAVEIDQPVETSLHQATGIIRTSLFASGQAAGLSDRVIMELVKIFAWDIDFALDIRPGDRFSVLYEEHYLGSEKVDGGDILAAQFTNRGTTHRAVRYTDPDGYSDYYTPDGYRLHRAFLRTPVEFSRITSGFDPNRYHPILHRIRAHTGVDYAAPIGTPVKATGNGRIAFAGAQEGYGNVVIIQHGERYSTLYGHLSRIAEGVAPGVHVRQGQVIGYVGQSGLATGPHLHYEFRIDGVHQNPMTVSLPQSEPVPAENREDFLRTSRRLLAELKAPTHVAFGETPRAEYLHAR